MAAVIASDLTKRFERICAVDGVDLAVGEGEVTGLLGPNGAGKTTLLRMLLGLVRPDRGTIELFGRTFHSAEPLVLEGVSGFVEEPSFYPYLSGRANLELLVELDRGGSGSRVDDVLDQVELAGRAGERVSGYSSGMRQRLGIAAALLRAPRLLLLDEPTAGLDPGGVRLVGELLRSLSAKGVAVLLSSHQIGEVEGVCDSFVVLSRGRVVWDGTAEQMRSEAPPSAYRMATSDDRRALALARISGGIQAEPSSSGELIVRAEDGALDAFVLALGSAGVAVRRLDAPSSPLESMFFALTDQSEPDPAPRPHRAEAESAER
ncbi:MAG: ABC transporter ATP-binding protein [Solirubrobacteraceae bacterium]